MWWNLDTFDDLPFIIVDVELVVGVAGGDAGHEDGEEAAEEAGHPVQVVHAARVVDPQLGQQEGLRVSGGTLSVTTVTIITSHLNILEAEGGERPRDGPDGGGAARGEHEVRACAHGHAARQGRVLEVLHTHPPRRGEQARHDHRGDGAAGQLATVGNSWQ